MSSPPDQTLQQPAAIAGPTAGTGSTTTPTTGAGNTTSSASGTPAQGITGPTTPGQNGQPGTNQTGSQPPVPGNPDASGNSTGFGSNGNILIPGIVTIAGPTSTVPNNSTANLLLPLPPPGLNNVVSQPQSQLSAGALPVINVLPRDQRTLDPFSVRLVGGSRGDTDQPVDRNRNLDRVMNVAMAELEESDELQPDKPAVAASSSYSANETPKVQVPANESPKVQEQAPVAAPAEQIPVEDGWYNLVPQSEDELQRWFEDMLLAPGVLNQPIPADVAPDAELAGLKQE